MQGGTPLLRAMMYLRCVTWNCPSGTVVVVKEVVVKEVVVKVVAIVHYFVCIACIYII